MPSRLLDSDPQRERRRQMLLIERIERKFVRRYRSEIVEGTETMLAEWEAMGQVGDSAEHRKSLEATMKQNWRASIEALAGRIREQAKAAGYPQVAKAEAEDAFDLYEQEYLQAFGAEQVRQVSDTTKQQILAQIERGREEGLGVDEIGRKIRDNAPSLAAVRANVIARTETHSAGNFAATKQAKDSGVAKRKEWIAANDSRTRDADDAFNHERADGQTVGMDEPFVVGGESLEYPGDSRGSAGNVINCRCAVGYIVDD
jgi:hypothetical protein